MSCFIKTHFTRYQYLNLYFSTLSSEVPTVPYEAAKSLENRRLHLERTCAKYNDNLKYEYRALHDVPESQIFQDHVAQSKEDFDHLNKYMHCESGAWDKSYMRGLRGRTYFHKYNHHRNESQETLRILARMHQEEFREAVKDYNRYVLISLCPLANNISRYHKT